MKNHFQIVVEITRQRICELEELLIKGPQKEIRHITESTLALNRKILERVLIEK